MPHRNSVVLLIVLLSGCAFTESASGQELVSYVIQTFALVLTSLLLMLGKKATSLFEAKSGVALNAQMQHLLDTAVVKGIAYAEEQAHKAVKQGLDTTSAVPKGATKRDLAVGFALNMLEENNVAKYSSNYITSLVEAQVQTSRPFKGV